MGEIFNGYFVKRKNIFTQADARLKFSVITLMIIAILLSPSLYLTFSMSLLAIIGLILIRASFKIICLRLSLPAGIALSIFAIKVFVAHADSYGSSLLVLRIMCTSALIILLTLTTAPDEFLKTLIWFRLSPVWAEIAMIAYRYVFVIFEDMLTVFCAQKIRLGYSGLSNSLRSIGVLTGMVIIRAYDQSISTYQAMLLRGYKEGE